VDQKQSGNTLVKTCRLKAVPVGVFRSSVIPPKRWFDLVSAIRRVSRTELASNRLCQVGRDHDSSGRSVASTACVVASFQFLDPTAVRRADGVEFLGFVLRSRRADIRVSAKNFDRLKTRVRELSSRNRGISFGRMLRELSRYLRGWMGYFGLASTKKVFSELDGWIRRRARMYVWKQWRLPRTRIRNLLRLGVSRDQAITHGPSRKGYWRLAKTRGGHVGMTNEWLRDQGLVFLRYLWGDLAPLRRTA
jgi:hypothetical protein